MPSGAIPTGTVDRGRAEGLVVMSVALKASRLFSSRAETHAILFLCVSMTRVGEHPAGISATTEPAGLLTAMLISTTSKVPTGPGDVTTGQFAPSGILQTVESKKGRVGSAVSLVT